MEIKKDGGFIPQDHHLESAKAQKHLRMIDRALLPRSEGGLIVPMQFAKPLPEEAGLLYPRVEPDAEGLTPGLLLAEDVPSGVLSSIGYMPGFEKPFVTGCEVRLGTDGYIYDNPVYNLPMRQQALLLQSGARAVEKKQQVEDDMTVPPAPSVEPRDGSLGILTEEGWTRLCNFVPQVQALLTIKKRGQEDRQEVVLQIKRKASHAEKMTIPCTELDRAASLVTRRLPSCQVMPEVPKGASYIANFIREQTATAPQRVVIKSVGFERFGDQWIYVHDGAVPPDPSATFATGCTISRDPRLTTEQALRHALAIPHISSRSELMVPLFLLAHLGPLFELFFAAGYPPRFVTFLNGTTGSLKTATCLALYRLFDQQKPAPEVSFTATEAGLEFTLGKAFSRTLLVDDYQPAVTAAAGRANLQKLEYVIRLVGDGIGKARGTAELELAKERRPVGCCIITGEDTGGSQSTLLRCLVLSISQGDIDGRSLKVYQDHPEYLSTHMYDFLSWCGKHGVELIELIRGDFQREREQFTQVAGSYRQADIGANLALVEEILLRYIADSGVLPADEVKAIRTWWRDAITQAVRTSDQYGQTMDPAAMFLTAVFDLYAGRKIEIAPTQEEFCPKRYLGFAKDDRWWLLPKETFTLVVHYWQDLGQMFPLKPAKIWDRLYAAGLTDAGYETRNGQERTLFLRRSTTDGRPRMLVLNVDAAAKYRDEHQN